MNEEGCPFCGSHDLGIRRGTEDREGFFTTHVYCRVCGASGPWVYSRDGAAFTCTALACEVTGWNRRAKAAEAGQQPATQPACQAETAHNTQSAAIAQIAARLEHRVRTDRQMSSEEAWQDVVTEAVRQLRAL